MSKVVIVGGKLQGIEACYLAKKAGIETVLIDKDETAPATKLCDHFLCMDILKKEESMIEELQCADFVLPALENDQVLFTLTELAQQFGFSLAFDFDAYMISSSKQMSDQLFQQFGIPSPKHYPNCKAPYIVKPSKESGSKGVQFIQSEEDLKQLIESISDLKEWIIQEYLDGPSYSIEIIGRPGNYRTYGITQIHMDSDYDCKKVSAPCNITEGQRKSFERMAHYVANLIQLHGIMDLEVIDDCGELKLLEIDARFPSQTPIVVYHSTEMNLIEELYDIFCFERFRKPMSNKIIHTTLEHFLIHNGNASSHGEHIMSQGEKLMLRRDFYGADEVLSDFGKKKNIWRGTFINWADSRKRLNEKRIAMKGKLYL